MSVYEECLSKDTYVVYTNSHADTCPDRRRGCISLAVRRGGHVLTTRRRRGAGSKRVVWMRRSFCGFLHADDS